MKKFFAIISVMFCCVSTIAQEQTTHLTLFGEYKPAIIHLSSGKTIHHNHANIGLKEADLLYLQGVYTMQANMELITGVDINGKSYVKIEKRLAECLDTVADNQLFCSKIIDMNAYHQQLKNNKNITQLDLNSDVTSYTTIDLENEADRQLPIIYLYYYRYNGKVIKVHERDIWNHLPKDKRHIYKTIISLPDFSWTRRESLVQLLQAITK